MADGRAKKGLVIVIGLLAAIAAGIYYYYSRMPAEESPMPWEVASPYLADAPRGAEKTTIDLFFSSPDGSALVAEQRVIPMAGDPASRCRRIIVELLAGPLGDLAPLVPPEMKIRAIFIADNVLVIDLEQEITGVQVGVYQETLVWYSLINSIIMHVKEIGGVRFLVNGQEEDNILGHMDMRGVFPERLDLVRWY